MALEQSLEEARSESRRLRAQANQESDACAADIAAAALYGDVALLSVRLLQTLDLQAERQAEHGQLAGGVEALQRTLHSSQAALVQRRAEMQTLGTQIEAHRVEALMQRKVRGDVAGLGVCMCCSVAFGPTLLLRNTRLLFLRRGATMPRRAFASTPRKS